MDIVFEKEEKYSCQNASIFLTIGNYRIWLCSAKLVLVIATRTLIRIVSTIVVDTNI